MNGRAEADGGALRVVVALHNRTDAPARDVTLTGELDSRDAASEGALEVPAGGDAEAVLLFPGSVSRPGLHTFLARIDFRSGTPPSQGDDPLHHQLAFLAFPLGARPAPAVELHVPPARLDWSGVLQVGVTPLDGTTHRVSLRAFTAPGLRAVPESVEIQLEPGAPVRVPLRLLRSGGIATPRDGVLVEARILDGPLERSSVAAAEVELTSTRGWLPAHRSGVMALALALVVAALIVELRRYYRA